MEEVSGMPDPCVVCSYSLDSWACEGCIYNHLLDDDIPDDTQEAVISRETGL